MNLQHGKSRAPGRDLLHCVAADNVGDNVGDIAGMGADLFGSFAESTCAALVVSSFADYASYSDCQEDCDKISWVAMLYPLLISAFGIFVCLITTFVATDWKPAKKCNEIEKVLKLQLVISAVIMTPVSQSDADPNMSGATACHLICAMLNSSSAVSRTHQHICRLNLNGQLSLKII